MVNCRNVGRDTELNYDATPAQYQDDGMHCDGERTVTSASSHHMKYIAKRKGISISIFRCHMLPLISSYSVYNNSYQSHKQLEPACTMKASTVLTLIPYLAAFTMAAPVASLKERSAEV
jgi:hypothetical protein